MEDENAESLRTDGRRMPSDDKGTNDLWPSKLKYWRPYCNPNYARKFIYILVSVLKIILT